MRDRTVAFIIGSLLVSAGFLAFFLDSQQSIQHYWNGSNIVGELGAPNGKYLIQVVYVFNDGTVQAPLCEHSIGHLHGVWEYDDSSVNFDGYELPELFFVTLKNNVIINSRQATVLH